MNAAHSALRDEGSFALRWRLWPTAALLVLLFCLLFLRAGPRLLVPGVWDEDGTTNLPGYLNNGIWDLANPVAGYLLLAPKLITQLAASISLSRYAAISTSLAWVATIACLYLVATMPTLLRGGWLLPIAALLVPSDPEVFGLPLYLFWWTGLLLVILAFWIPAGDRWILRYTMLVLASLSSPYCYATLPLFWLRAWLLRADRGEIWFALAATVLALIQGYTVLQNAGPGILDITDLAAVIPKFFGSYLVGNIAPDWLWVSGAVSLAFMLWGVVRDPSPAKLGLLFLVAISITLVMYRLDLDLIHPKLAGPRYFFYAFVLQSWLLIQIALTETLPLRVAAWALLGLSLVNLVPVVGRSHDDLQWAEHIDACRHFDRYSIPVHFAGQRTNVWFWSVTRAQCEGFHQRDLLPARSGKSRFAYSVSKWNPSDGLDGCAGTDRIVVDHWTSPLPTPELPGVTVRDSYGGSDTHTGSLLLKLRRGDCLLYRLGPRAGSQAIKVQGFARSLPFSNGSWVRLDFSHDQLPDEFLVKFSDNGKRWGEWSAVGFKAD